MSFSSVLRKKYEEQNKGGVFSRTTSKYTTPTSYRTEPRREDQPSRLGGAVEETSGISDRYRRIEADRRRLQEQSDLRRELEAERMPTDPLERERKIQEDLRYMAESRKAELERKDVRKEESKQRQQEAKKRIKMLQEERKPLMRKRREELTPEQATRRDELDRQIAELAGTSSPFAVGVFEGAVPGSMSYLDTKTRERIGEDAKGLVDQASQETGYGAGKLTGTIGRQLGTYAVVGGALRGTALGQKILGAGGAKGIIGQQALDLAVDTIAQAPSEYLEAVREDKTLGQAAKDFAVNRVIDVAFNVAIGGLTGDFKKAKQVLESPETFKVLKQAGVDESVLKQAVDSNDPQAMKDVLDQFTEYRKANFGGAFGKLQDDELRALEDMFKMDTGLDARVAREATEGGAFTKAKQTVESPRATEQTRPLDDIDVSVGTSPARFVETAKESPLTSKQVKEKLKTIELETTTNEARRSAAEEIVNSDFEGAVAMSKEGKRFSSDTEAFVSEKVVSRLQELGRHDEAVEVIETMAQKFRKAGQDVQAASVWSKLTPQGMQRWASNTFDNAIKEVDKEIVNKTIIEVGEDMKAINEMTPKELAARVAEKLNKNANDPSIIDQIVGNRSYDDLKDLNVGLTMKKVTDKLPVATARQLSTVQAFSHLLNAKTFLRNIGGNTASVGLEIINKLPSSMADRLLSMYSGNRTVVASMPKFKQALNQGLKEGKKSIEEILLGVSRAPQGKYDLFFGSTFKSKVGQNLEKALSLSLQTPDQFFKGFVAADSLYNQVKARLGKQVDDWDFGKILTEATEQEIKTSADEALFATFQNDSALASFMSEAKKTLNKIHIDPNKKFMKEVGEFGLGDLIIKYTRVPGNIITRAFEYSPLGLGKAFATVNSFAKATGAEQQLLQRQAAQQLGRAATGSGLVGLGMALNKLGIITGAEDSDNYNVQAFNRSEGLGDYKVNMSALSRWLTGGDPAKKSGDKIMNYNWLEPINKPVAIGARLAQSNPQTTGDWINFIKKDTMEEALDLSMLFVVKSMFYESMNPDSGLADVMSVPIEQALPGFVPSGVRQLAQTIDPTIRQTETPTDKIKANIPFLSKTLPPKLDPLGREQQRTGGIIGGMISPATVTEFTPSNFGDKLRNIADLSGNTSIFPDRKAPNSTTYKKEKLTLTAEEKQRWQEVEGKEIERLYTRFLKNKTVSSEKKAIELAEALEKIKRDASEKAKKDFLKGRK